MLTPDVAYLGKMEQLTGAGSSLGGQSGNPPEAPEARPTPRPHPSRPALPHELTETMPPTPPLLLFPSHFLKGHGEGSCFLTPESPSNFQNSPNLNQQLQKHFSQVTN